MRRPAVVASVFGVLCGCAALASCAGGGEPGGAVAPSSAGVAADPIPAVREPKELAGASPCELLTAEQLVVNRIDQPGEPGEVLGAPSCVWRDVARTREIGIFVVLGHDVLSNVYAQRETFPVFEVTEVAGHPAIRTKDNVDGTSCVFRVAATRTQTLNLDFVSLRQGLEEPCGPAQELAATVMGNLPPGTG